MPFGIQLKGVIVGILIAYFLIPWVQGLWLSRTAPKAA